MRKEDQEKKTFKEKWKIRVHHQNERFRGGEKLGQEARMVNM